MGIDTAVAKRLEKVKTYLAVKHAFFGVLLSTLDVHEMEQIGTMATNGSKLFYNKDFFNGMTDEQLRYVLLHEVMHVAYLHVGSIRMMDKDPRKWNYACDYVINMELEELRKREPGEYEFPVEGGLRDAKFEGKMAEVVYREIPDNMKMKFSIGRGSCPKCGGAGKYKEKCKTCHGLGTVDKDCPACGGTGKDDEGKDCSRCEGAGKEDEKCPDCNGSGKSGKTKQCDCGSSGDGFYDGDLLRPESREDVDEMRDKILQAFEATKGRNQGYIPAGLARAIERMKKARVPWQRIFQSFVGQALAKDDYFFSRPNRRYLAQDLFLPDLRNMIVGKVVLAIDTSGSISPKQLAQFAAELKKVSHLVSETTVIMCDAAVHEVVKINQMEDFLGRLKFGGGGGTDFRPVFDYVRKHNMHPELLIYLTDSYGSFPKEAPFYRILWVLTEEDQEKNIPWGAKVTIPGGAAAERYR